MKTGLGSGAKLTDDKRLLVVDLPFGLGDVRGLVLVPADVLVGADDVELFTEGIVDDLRHTVGANEKRGGDESSGIVGPGIVGECGEKLRTLRCCWGLVGNGPEDDGCLVTVASNHLVELVLRLDESGGVFEVAGPVDGNLGPDENAETVGGAGHALIVRIVGETGVVAA